MDNNKTSSPKHPRRRARKADGTFQGDNPSTPELNEAWEPTDVAEAVGEKEVKYTIKPKVDSTSDPSAGKYSRTPKIRPTFGKAYTTYN